MRKVGKIDRHLPSCKFHEVYSLTIKLYSYQKCSTCRQATKFLEARGLDHQTVDITLTPPSRSELDGMLKAVGGALRKLLNTSGQVYREMQLSTKLPHLSTDEVMNLLATNGKLIKRPFLLVNGKAVAVGFDQAKWSSLLAAKD
ncbi:MAG: Spx/MgsR family RNA polymerase-binding regulatory protein [Deltaproteobacteria bacterium]|nr:Spx/MgsR family RNA polymerase-binding regulatory protein [Deltaproteobacteria bacterium]